MTLVADLVDVDRAKAFLYRDRCALRGGGSSPGSRASSAACRPSSAARWGRYEARATTTALRGGPAREECDEATSHLLAGHGRGHLTRHGRNNLILSGDRRVDRDTTAQSDRTKSGLCQTVVPATTRCAPLSVPRAKTKRPD